MNTARIDPADLVNPLRVAIDRFESNAQQFDALAGTEPTENSLIPSGTVAERLADQFRAQAKQARELLAILDAAEPFEVEYDPE